ncbi:MAG: hypothetical protein H0Z38_06220 [Firmicutes bacterium]|nr:hypothetical protein [Bacillota bacterium]
MPEEKVNWVTVYQGLESYDTLEVKNLLQEAGIPCRLQGDRLVQVPAKRAATAKELVDARPDKADF